MHKLRDTWRAWLVEKRVGPTNEPLPEDPDGPTSRRDTLWYRLQGEDYLALALRACAAVVPLSELVINEYDLEFVGDRFERKRSAMLNMAYKLKRLNAPLHAIGLQAHLRGERTIDRRGLQSLLTELKAMGLGVVISELVQV